MVAQFTATGGYLPCPFTLLYRDSPDPEMSPPSDSVRLRREFGQAIGDVSRAWRVEMNRLLKPYGLNASMRQVMLQLQRHPGGLMQRELAEALGIEGPTLVRLLDRLERDGWVRRLPGTDDRRRKHAALTPAAVAKLEELERVADAARERTMRGMSRADLEAGLALMQAMRGNLQGH